MATPALATDVETLERSLQGDADWVDVTISRQTAQFLAQVARAKADGQEVVITHGFDEVSPAEAATLLGMSRPQVRKLIDRGLLPFRMVGTHHRIPIAGMKKYVTEQRQRREAGLAELAELQNELGLVE